MDIVLLIYQISVSSRSYILSYLIEVSTIGRIATPYFRLLSELYSLLLDDVVFTGTIEKINFRLLSELYSLLFHYSKIIVAIKVI